MFFSQIGLMPMQYPNAVKKGKKQPLSLFYINNYQHVSFVAREHSSVFLQIELLT